MKRPKIPPDPKDLFAEIAKPQLLSVPKRKLATTVLPAAAAPPQSSVTIGKQTPAPYTSIAITGSPKVKHSTLDKDKSCKAKSLSKSLTKQVKKKAKQTTGEAAEVPKKKKVIITPDLKAVLKQSLQRLLELGEVPKNQRQKVRVLLTILGA